MKKFKTYIAEVSTGKLVDYVARASQDVGRRIEKAEPGEKPFKKIMARSGKIGRAMAHVKMRTNEQSDACTVCGQTPCNCTHLDEGTVQDKIDKVGKIYNAHRSLADKARRVGPGQDRDPEAEAHHMTKSSKAFKLMQKMREKQSEANKSNPKPRPKSVDYGAAIAKDYKDQEKKRGIGHVRDHVEIDGTPIMELNRDTLHSYSRKADKEVESKYRVLGPQMKAGDVASANKTSHKITRRLFGLDRASDRLNKEEFVGFKAFAETLGEEAKPHEIHVSPAKNGQYKVHAVGSKFAHGIKVGEHLNDTHLDDFSEMGGKIKMVKAKKD
jgi:hypothetical protein